MSVLAQGSMCISATVYLSMHFVLVDIMNLCVCGSVCVFVWQKTEWCGWMICLNIPQHSLPSLSHGLCSYCMCGTQLWSHNNKAQHCLFGEFSTSTWLHPLHISLFLSASYLCSLTLFPNCDCTETLNELFLLSLLTKATPLTLAVFPFYRQTSKPMLKSDQFLMSHCFYV